jgi:phosphoribosylanthranilate isomerase
VNRIKICGVTRPEDASLACDLGAWAVGMILSPRGPRALDLKRAEQVRRAISASAIGVFVDETADRVNEVATALGLDRVQLHGNEPPAMLEELVVPAIKVFAIDVDKPVVPDVSRYGRAWAVLLDAKVGAESGGTGRAFDWPIAKRVRGPRVIVAGGIDPDNVRDALEATKAYAVDVSSGVESAPGVKDRALLEKLFRAAN